MSDQDNPFETTPVTPPASDVIPADQLLASIKNEQGEQKYKSVEDALKALANSQAFIPKLIDEKKIVEQELQSLREKASKIDSIEEVVRKLTEKQAPQVETPPASGVSADQVAELVKRQLEQANVEAQARKNFSDVQIALKQKFGDKTREEVAKKAAELGVTPDKLGELASQSPAMVLALFNSAKPTVASPTPAGSFSLPPVPKPTSVPAPAKSVLLGATSRDQKAHLLDHKKAVYEKYNVTV